jgi:dTDP-glucose 4,6-dehydratase
MSIKHGHLTQVVATSLAWLMGGQLLITGATGFFGRALLRRLIQFEPQNGNIVALTRDPAGFLTCYPEFADISWLEFRKGDILHRESLPKCRFSHVIHAAADSTGGTALNAIERFSQIVDGTRNMLEWAVASGVKRFLYTSSGAIYGAQPPHIERLPEDWIGAPPPELVGSAYGTAKRAAECLCALYAGRNGLEPVIARGFAFIGPDLPLEAHFAIGNFIRDAMADVEIKVNGDGSPLRSYLHQDDLADWLLGMLLHGQPGRCYNLGSDVAVSVAELAQLVRDIIAPQKPVRILGAAAVDRARSRYVPDISRARLELGLTVRIGLSEAIEKTWRQISSR